MLVVDMPKGSYNSKKTAKKNARLIMKLTKNGYIIKKREITLEEIKKIKSELTVSPFILNDFGNGNEKRFSK